MSDVIGPVIGARALRYLMDTWDFPKDQAQRILSIARTHTADAEPVPGGILHIRYRGNVSGSRPVKRLYEFEPDVMTEEERKRFNSQRKGLASGREKVYTREDDMPSRYSSGKARTNQRKERTAKMPPRKTRKAPEPEVNEQPANGEGPDLATTVQKALDKENFSPTMNDYLDWFTDNVVDPNELADDLDRLMVMALQFYGPFQRSDFNRERREARASERASARQAQDEEEEPAKPARGTRTAKATSGRAAKAPAAKASPAKAGPTRRTRGTKAAAASGSTPF